MLLHWFRQLQQDELEVIIQPRRLTLLRTQRHWRDYFKPPVIARAVIDINEEELKTQAEPWSAAITTLGNVLKDAKWQGAVVNVILSNHFVRYTIIPWNTHLSKPAEQQAYLTHCFSLVFGDQIKNWNLQSSTSSYGKSSLASAVPQAMLNALYEALQSAHVRVQSITPQLVPAINQSFAQISSYQGKNKLVFTKKQTAPTCWLVVIQQDRLCMALIDNGHWLSVSNVMIETDASTQVTAMIQRNTINHNVESKLEVLLYWPDSHHNQSLQLETYTVIKLLQNPLDHLSKIIPTAITSWEAT